MTFVGAGSVEFTRNVVTDLCGYPEFRGRLRLTLYDISAERLAHAERLARRISEQSGGSGTGATVTATLDRREALAGARYVINEVQVGGYAATRADFDIPARYGVRQTIGDTLGIGGIFRGLRTIPVTVALARDMAEVCPDAYLLSYSNPMAMLPWAVYEGSEFTRVFGLCHSVRDTQAFLTQLTGADPERVRFLTGLATKLLGEIHHDRLVPQDTPQAVVAAGADDADQPVLDLDHRDVECAPSEVIDQDRLILAVGDRGVVLVARC